MIRQHRRNNPKHRDEEKRGHDDAELEAARQLEEDMIRERAEWEARYGGGDASHALNNRGIAKTISIHELPVDEHEIHKKASSDSTAADSPGLGRRTREANRETFYIASETESQTSSGENLRAAATATATAEQTQLPLPLFNVVPADHDHDHDHDHDENQSTASAVIGSEMDALRSAARSRTPTGQQWPPAENTPDCEKPSGASTSSNEHGDRKAMTERDITEQVPRLEDGPKQEEPDVQEPQQSPTGDSRTQEPNPKRASLNEDTIKDLPQRASRIVQSYRTNEWAKHLDDAEIPEPPPIRPIEENQPKIPVEGVAPVNVNELLQTPLDAQPPPAVERKQPNSNSNNSPPRGSHELQSKQTNTSPSASSSSSKDDSRSQRPTWKGPPPLLAVREDLVRSKPSSTCVSTDPWLRFRNNPRDLNTIRPRIPGGSPGEQADQTDDLPLSQRRAMLQTQAQAPPDVHSPQTRGNHNPDDAHAIMATWRNSVHEDLRGRRNPYPLGPSARNSATSGGPLPGLDLGPAEQQPSSSSRASFPSPSGPFAFGQSPRDRTSAMTLHVENMTAMQRGDMHDLHREAIKRLQASATRRA